MKLIVCSAFYKEVEYLIRYFKPRQTAAIKNKYPVFYYTDNVHEIYFMVIGMGAGNTGRTIKHYIRELNLDNDYLWILTGYAGSLNKNLKAGMIAAPALITGEEGRFEIETSKYSGGNNRYRLHTVKVVLNRDAKMELKKNTQDIDLIDMEASAFCRTLRDNGISNFFVYKAITDELDFILPDPALIRDSIRKIKWQTWLQHLKDWKNAFILYYNMDKASRQIAWFFKRFYERNCH